MPVTELNPSSEFKKNKLKTQSPHSNKQSICHVLFCLTLSLTVMYKYWWNSWNANEKCKFGFPQRN